MFYFLFVYYHICFFIILITHFKSKHQTFKFCYTHHLDKVFVNFLLGAFPSIHCECFNENLFPLTLNTGTSDLCPNPVTSTDGTLCNDDSNTCLNGDCIGSVCFRINETECQCTGNPDELCHVCCTDNSTGTERCVSTYRLVSTYICCVYIVHNFLCIICVYFCVCVCTLETGCLVSLHQPSNSNSLESMIYKLQCSINTYLSN